jgi:lantibiotic leader peptide-processing serine protease
MRAQVWRPVVVAALIVVLGAMAGASVAYSAPSASGRYLVVFKSSTLPGDAAQRVLSNGGTVVRLFAPVGVIAAIGDGTFVSKMSKDAKVQSVGIEHSFGLPETTVQPLAEDGAAVVEVHPCPPTTCTAISGT